MARKVIGLDIDEEHIAAVLVEQRSAKEKRVVWSSYASFASPEQIREAMEDLFNGFALPSGARICCGLPLANCALRNVSLPFKDEKKISQTLPFELQEQLLSPVDQQLVEYLITHQGENGSQLLVAALEKELLRGYLSDLQTVNLEPEVALPGAFCLAQQFLEQVGVTRGDMVLIDTGLHSLSLVVCHRGKIVFTRVLPYPNKVFTEGLFTLTGDDQLIIDETGDTLSCFGGLCATIERGIDYFGQENGIDIRPEYVLLSGPLATADLFIEKIQEEFGWEVIVADLRRIADVGMDETADAAWRPERLNRALAVALQGFRKKTLLNFIKGEFSRKLLFFRSKQQMLIAAAVSGLLLLGTISYLTYTNSVLQQRYDQLHAGMWDVFRNTFPETTITRGDPLHLMRSKLMEVGGGGENAMPLFPRDKRTLNILADISRRIPASLSLRVSRMLIDEDSARIKGNTDTYNDVNAIEGYLEKSEFYEDVNIMSATQDSNTNDIRFEIRLRLREER